MELFLVRHGQTDANRNGIVQGWLDTDLNDTGVQQAKDAANAFHEDIEAIYSSDLKRATQTAEYFREKCPDLPYVLDKRLRERDFGDATGDHRDKHDWEVFWASSDTVCIPNAETLETYNRRVLSFITSLKATQFSRVLIVTHGGTINRFQDLTGSGHGHITHANASVTKIVI